MVAYGTQALSSTCALLCSVCYICCNRIMQWKGASNPIKEIQIKLHLKNSCEAAECVRTKKGGEGGGCKYCLQFYTHFNFIFIHLLSFMKMDTRIWCHDNGRYGQYDDDDDKMQLPRMYNYPKCNGEWATAANWITGKRNLSLTNWKILTTAPKCHKKYQ